MRYCVGSVQYTDPTQEIRVRSCRINEHELNHRDQEVRIDDQSVHCEKKTTKLLRSKRFGPKTRIQNGKGTPFELHNTFFRDNTT